MPIRPYLGQLEAGAAEQGPQHVGGEVEEVRLHDPLPVAAKELRQQGAHVEGGNEQKSVACKTNSGGAGETIRTLLYAVGIALVIRTLAFEPFSVPSESMLPTLLVGDYFFISKWPYGYSRYSLPFGPPVMSGRIFGQEPERGDVIVFQRGGTDPADYVKRLVGLPGDRIQVRDGALWVNDDQVRRDAVEPTTLTPDQRQVSRGTTVFRETMSNGTTYLTLDRGDIVQDHTAVYIVPAGRYMMMGDNRDNSHDSRFPDFGMIPFEGLEGRAGVIFFSVDGSAHLWEIWKWPTSIRLGRMMTLPRL